MRLILISLLNKLAPVHSFSLLEAAIVQYRLSAPTAYNDDNRTTSSRLGNGIRVGIKARGDQGAGVVGPSDGFSSAGARLRRKW